MSDTTELRDPVCGMRVDSHMAAASAQHKGHAYYFCSNGCHDKFVASPGDYLGQSLKERGAAGRGTYICPMHPQVKQVGPGACPICGMALEPESPSEVADDTELDDMTLRFKIATALTAPVLILAMGDMALPGSPVHELLGARVSQVLEFTLTTLVAFCAGWPLLVRGVDSIRRRVPNMFTLITIGVGVAYLHSSIAVFAPQSFPDAFRDSPGASLPQLERLSGAH